MIPALSTAAVPCREKREKLKSKKTDMLTSISEQSEESMSWRIKGRLWWEGFEEKEGFKPGVMEY